MAFRRFMQGNLVCDCCEESVVPIEGWFHDKFELEEFCEERAKELGWVVEYWSWACEKCQKESLTND